MVGQMFGQSNPQQQAGVLNQLLRSIGPGVLAALGGSILADVVANERRDPASDPRASGKVDASAGPEMRRRRNSMTPAYSTRSAASMPNTRSL
jgi:hypothetical protein